MVALFNAVAKSKRDAADSIKAEKLKKKAQLKAAGATVGLSITNDDHSVGSGGSLSIDSFVKNTETNLLKKRSLREANTTAENTKEKESSKKKQRGGMETVEKSNNSSNANKSKGWKVISDNLEEDVSLDWDKEDI